MGHDGFLQAIHQYELVPWDLPTDFPCAIHQVLLMEFPSSKQPLIDVGEVSNQEVVQVLWPGVTTHQAGCLFIARIICSMYRLADSDLMVLWLEMDPDDVEEVSIDLLD